MTKTVSEAVSKEFPLLRLGYKGCEQPSAEKVTEGSQRLRRPRENEYIPLILASPRTENVFLSDVTPRDLMRM